jgi:hypothetical protein
LGFSSSCGYCMYLMVSQTVCSNLTTTCTAIASLCGVLGRHLACGYAGSMALGGAETVSSQWELSAVYLTVEKGNAPFWQCSRPCGCATAAHSRCLELLAWVRVFGCGNQATALSWPFGHRSHVMCTHDMSVGVLDGWSFAALWLYVGAYIEKPIPCVAQKVLP